MMMRWLMVLCVSALGSLGCVKPGSGAATDGSSGTGASSSGATTVDVMTTTGIDTDESSDTSEGTSSSGGAPDEVYCPLDWSAASAVAGMTPVGPFEGKVGWFGWQECGGYRPGLVLVPNSALLAGAVKDGVFSRVSLDDAVVVLFTAGDWSDGAWTGETGGWVQSVQSGKLLDLNTEAVVTVTASVSVADTAQPVGAPHIVGTIAVSGGGWELTGEFDGAYCGLLNGALGLSCE